MVKWDHIEDTGPLPTRVWLSRKKLDDESAANPEEWKPLRKVDCQKLNDARNKSLEHGNCPVYIENGRSTADPDFGIIRANFVPKPPRELTSCTWFVIKEERKDPQTGNLRPVLEPMPDEQSELVEYQYMKAVNAASVYGEGIEKILKDKLDLGETCPDYHVEVCKEGGNYLMKKVPNGWFGKSFPLQRGHENYVYEGEEEEESLGPINHVVFVIHGIGENFFSKDKSLSMVETMDHFRLTFQKRQIADWKKKCDIAKRKKEPIPDPPNRVEFLPILWYDRVHNSNNAMTKSLMGVTLKTIPALRSIANDIVLDVLLYMTPNFCLDVLESVTDQIHSVYDVFNKAHPDFKSRGGKCSLIGHSLGSVISWDLLSLKKKSLHKNCDEHSAHLEASMTLATASSMGNTRSNVSQNRPSSNDNGSWGPSLPQPYDKVIPFEPEFTMFIGSPIGLFLSLRGAHDAFDFIRDMHPGKPRVSPFTLPTKAAYNIFSPSDPVAYRIEPLLLKQGTPFEELPDPEFLTRLGEGVRLHVKASQLVGFVAKSLSQASKSSSSPDLKRSVEEKEKKEKSSSFGGFLMNSISKVSKDLQASTDENEKSRSLRKEEVSATLPSDSDNYEGMTFPLAGRSPRLDYQMQHGVIDNEYLKAVSAHSTYFHNTDIVDFVIDIAGQSNTEVIDLTSDTEETSETDIFNSARQD